MVFGEKKRQPGHPWTVKELAAALRVSPAHIYQLINEGSIYAVQIGATKRIPDPEAQRLLGMPAVTAA